MSRGTDVDTDAIERLLAELEAPLPAKQQVRNARNATDVVPPPPVRGESHAAPAASRVELNPFAGLATEPGAAVEAEVAVPAMPTRKLLLRRYKDDPNVQSILSLVKEQQGGVAEPAAANAGSRKKEGRKSRATTDHSSAAAAQEGASAASDDGMMADMGDGFHPLLSAEQPLGPTGSYQPPSRADHSSALVMGSKIVIFGGLLSRPDGTATLTNQCVEYDTVSGTWEPSLPSRGTLPSARCLHAAASLDVAGLGVPRLMLVHGGRNAAGEGFNDAHLYDAVTQSWSAVVATGGKPSPVRFGHTAVGIRGKAYFFGGRTTRASDIPGDVDAATSAKQQLTSDVYVLDVVKSKWLRIWSPPAMDSAATGDEATGLASFPCRRHRHASCSSHDGTSFFVHGGLGASGNALNDLWRFDIAAKQWSRYERPGDGAIPRSRHAMAYVNDRVVLFGGVAAHDAGAAARADAAAVTSLGPGDGAWCNHRVLSSALPATRVGHTVTTALGSAFLFGGRGPAELAGATLQCVAMTVDWRCTLASASADGALEGQRALRLALDGEGAPFDVLFDFADGAPLIGAHASVLAARAPVLARAIAKCAYTPAPNDVTTTRRGAPVHPAANVYCLVGRRGAQGLAVDIPRESLAALLEYLYTANVTVKDDESGVTLQSLGPIAAAYHIEHLDALVANVNPLTATTTPSDAVETKDVKRVAAGKLAAEAALRRTLVDMSSDAASADCEIVVRHALPRAGAAVAVPCHAVVVASLNPVLRRLLGGTTAALRLTGSPARGYAKNAGGDGCTERASGVAVLTRYRDGAGLASHAHVEFDFPSTADTEVQSAGIGATPLPPSAAAIRAVVQYSYTGSIAEVGRAPAIDVLLTARALACPALCAVAERAVMADVETITARFDPTMPNDFVANNVDSAYVTQVCALLHLAVRYQATHILARSAIAAAVAYPAVSIADGYLSLPPAVQQRVAHIARQLGVLRQ